MPKNTKTRRRTFKYMDEELYLLLEEYAEKLEMSVDLLVAYLLHYSQSRDTFDPIPEEEQIELQKKTIKIQQELQKL